ncbi:unnamed protein product [Peronospora belbahrii]|uniref:Uncharacterized protein n=1 Tax=Peronospora belbahrii TaxID=622444 RepID=A0AAU9L6A8_9STRA|nr:unnamed protein product [Peronospora belbahrii]
MFWGLGGGKSNATPARNRADASRWSNQYAEIVSNSGIPPVPSHVLSEQRRSELLLAARSNRVSWVDGVDEHYSKTLAVDFNDKLPHTHVSSAPSSHCRETLEEINLELSQFFESLTELKHKILTTDLQLKGEQSEACSDGGRFLHK